MEKGFHEEVPERHEEGEFADFHKTITACVESFVDQGGESEHMRAETGQEGER